MLKSLTISNYALIDNLEISFPSGLLIITGETGAGKSILMGAISLLFGTKADPTVLKDKTKNCVVEALFSGFGQDEIILRRVVSPSGKSRSFLNDEPVTINVLRELSDKLVDIHAQHQHLLLSDSNFQLSVLDTYAGNESLLAEYREVYENVSRTKRLCNELETKIQKEETQAEFNRFQYEKLKQANLREGELEELEEEFRVLSNAGEIKNALFQATELISPSGEDISLLQKLKETQSILDKISGNYRNVVEIASRVESCRLELKDIEQELRSRAESVNVTPERASLLEERISAIYKLMNIHHVKNVESLLKIMEELHQSLERVDIHTSELENARKEMESLNVRMEELSGTLHGRRLNHLEEFVCEITSAIRNLEMPYARFEVKIEKTEDYNIWGRDSVIFFFSANKNIETRELSKVASGGEISRIMLCLKAVLASRKDMPAMILDEIDSGVSGSIADKMGDLIAQLSKKMQIFAVTHLPQIASKGNTHFLVYKEIAPAGTTRTKIREITGDERVMELARMLSGSETSAAAVANAEELLGFSK
jgi:DNA repair protein RecN (Recombination protein N)